VYTTLQQSALFTHALLSPVRFVQLVVLVIDVAWAYRGSGTLEVGDTGSLNRLNSLQLYEGHSNSSYRLMYTVVRKKRGSTFMIITLENLDGF